MEKLVPSDLGRGYYEKWVDEIGKASIPDDFPLSHALVAKHLAPMIPSDANMHFAILNSLRFWEFFPLARSIKCYSNVAGFGIDGDLSTFLGQSVASKTLNFLIIGDLSFFYDMNAIGIRHVRNNVRIVLVNNHGGGEFRLNTHAANQFGDDSNRHIAAAGHFGDSAEGWVTNNHFKYLGVRSKDELDHALQILVQPSDSPIVVEVFTTMSDDAASLQAIIDANDRTTQSQKHVRTIKECIPHDLKQGIKRMIGR
jgi:2-succinyl-5-enolpyruvyl-6-hydroxy-3-cyclohexene-1-carboxylate synthase